MNKLFLIAGPCIIENSETPLLIGKEVKSICDELGIDFIFKASYKKANRTRIDSFKGIGFQESLEILQGVGRETGCAKPSRMCMKVMNPNLVANYVDILQIPAFLCRQTELLLSAGQTGKGVSIKKGQFVSPEAMKYPWKRSSPQAIKTYGFVNGALLLVMKNLVVDVTAVPKLKKAWCYRWSWIVHIHCSNPIKKTASRGGDPEMIASVAFICYCYGCRWFYL